MDVSGLHEVELTVRACARGGRPFRIVGDNGASVAKEEGTLVVRAAREAGARPVRRQRYVSEGTCGDRELVLQTGRMELARGGLRLCSPHLLPVEGEWTIELGDVAERAELCFRRAEVPSGDP